VKRPRRHHPLLISALLLALFVRALVPEGFMPAKGEMVELCTMHGPRMAMADPETGEILQTEDEQSAPPCPFSLILTALAAPSVPALHFATTPSTAHVATLERLPAGRASLALPPARAPPVPDPA
jgi:hypothetical protein